MKNTLKIFLFSILILCLSALTACRHSNKPIENVKTSETKEAFHTLFIAPAPLEKMLYFSGQIEPLHQTPVTSPVNGILLNQQFKFGQNIKKDQPLFTIRSSEQQSDFEQAMTDYLQKKQTNTQNKQDFDNNTTLFNEGLISRNDFDSSKNTFLLGELALLHAKAQVEKLLQYHKEITDIDRLSINDLKTVISLMHFNQAYQDIHILSPDNGTALLPINNSSSVKINIGDEVKVNQLLLILSPREGLSVNIGINEININQIEIGQKATITSVALPGLVLSGYISDIAAQATDDQNLPTFSAQITVPELTPKEYNQVKIGMSVKIAIPIIRNTQIMIPIKAVTFRNGENRVRKFDDTTKQFKDAVVTTGETTMNDVTILTGLKPGDKIAIPD